MQEIGAAASLTLSATITGDRSMNKSPLGPSSQKGHVSITSAPFTLVKDRYGDV